MNTAYWAGEFAKVLLAYVVLMYVWPSVLFRKHLKEKSRTYRFAFCSTVSIMLISTCVLGLGVFHILHKWLVCFLFYGSVLAERTQNRIFCTFVYSGIWHDIFFIRCFYGSFVWIW